MPGATPQSVITVMPCSRASPSSSNGSSAKKEISTISFFRGARSLIILQPMEPGSAPTTISASFTADRSEFLSDRSVVTALMFRSPLNLPRASSFRSTAVTIKSRLRSVTIALPTSPVPRTATLFFLSIPFILFCYHDHMPEKLGKVKYFNITFTVPLKQRVFNSNVD